MSPGDSTTDVEPIRMEAKGHLYATAAQVAQAPAIRHHPSPAQESSVPAATVVGRLSVGSCNNLGLLAPSLSGSPRMRPQDDSGAMALHSSSGPLESDARSSNPFTTEANPAL